MKDPRYLQLLADTLLDHYESQVEPDAAARGALTTRQGANARFQSAYLQIPGYDDLNEDLYPARALRYLEDLLAFGSLPESHDPETLEFLDIWTGIHPDLAVHRLNPTRETLNALLAQFSHEGTLEDKSDAPRAMQLLVITLAKLGIKDQELFDCLESMTSEYTNQYKPWSPDYDRSYPSDEVISAAIAAGPLGQDQPPDLVTLQAEVQARISQDIIVDSILAILASHRGDWYNLAAAIGQLPNYYWDDVSLATPGGDLLTSEFDLDHHVVDLMLKATRPTYQ